MKNTARCTTIALLCATLSTGAHAFDPFEGADRTPAPTPVSKARPSYTPPTRTPYAPIAFRPLPPSPIASVQPYTPPPMQAPVNVAPMQPVYAPSAYNAAPAYQSPPSPQVYVPPAPMTPSHALAAPSPSQVQAAHQQYPVQYAGITESSAPLVPAPQTYTDTYTPQKPKNSAFFGIEGFREGYEETGGSNGENTSLALSLAGGFEHHFTNTWTGGFDGRVSYGRGDYSAPGIGKADGISQWEVDFRTTTGYDYAWGNGNHLKPYIGLGAHYLRNSAAKKTTDLNNGLFTATTWQAYLPVGLSAEFNSFGLRFAPNIEYGYSLYSRTSLDSKDPALNGFNATQSDGHEIRGELMVGTIDEHGMGWQFGPFIRHWHFDDSKLKGTSFIPENDRTQIGAKAQLLF